MKSSKELKIIYRQIDELIPAEYNPRSLSEQQFEQIKQSLDTFGFVDPVIVNKHKDRMDVIVGGHQRVKVAKALNFKHAPTVEVKLTLEKEKELNVRLNKNTGEFDFDMLANHFDPDELIEWGFMESELGIFDFDEDDAPNLDEGDKPFQNMTFTLHDSQVEIVKQALKKAKAAKAGEDPINENENGNALSFICAQYNGKS